MRAIGQDLSGGYVAPVPVPAFPDVHMKVHAAHQVGLLLLQQPHLRGHKWSPSYELDKVTAPGTWYFQSIVLRRPLSFWRLHAIDVSPDVMQGLCAPVLVAGRLGNSTAQWLQQTCFNEAGTVQAYTSATRPADGSMRMCAHEEQSAVLEGSSLYLCDCSQHSLLT